VGFGPSEGGCAPRPLKAPRLTDFRDLLDEAQKSAEEAGLTKADVEAALQEVLTYPPSVCIGCLSRTRRDGERGSDGQAAHDARQFPQSKRGRDRLTTRCGARTSKGR